MLKTRIRYFQVLLPKLKAKPVRTASGVSFSFLNLSNNLFYCTLFGGYCLQADMYEGLNLISGQNDFNLGGFVMFLCLE